MEMESASPPRPKGQNDDYSERPFPQEGHSPLVNTFDRQNESPLILILHFCCLFPNLGLRIFQRLKKLQLPPLATLAFAKVSSK